MQQQGGAFAIWAGGGLSAVLMRAIEFYAVEASWCDEAARARKARHPSAPADDQPQDQPVPVRRRARS